MGARLFSQTDCMISVHARTPGKTSKCLIATLMLSIQFSSSFSTASSLVWGCRLLPGAQKSQWHGTTTNSKKMAVKASVKLRAELLGLGVEDVSNVGGARVGSTQPQLMTEQSTSSSTCTPQQKQFLLHWVSCFFFLLELVVSLTHIHDTGTEERRAACHQ
jgi:hypothetical protein